MNEWLALHPWTTFIVIFIFLAFVYNKVFRVRKLPLLKNLIMYVLLAVGSYMLLFFQIAVDLPIVLCLGIAILLMFIVKIRYFLTERFQKKS